MSLVLNIDTALDTASVCLARDGVPLALLVNENQKDHAAWLHPAIRELLEKTGLTLGNADAIAVSIGPGSYTGLRVGLSAAKGLCYTLDIPLLAVNTLEMIAFSVKDKAKDLICPLIDARRMEVFTAIYDKELQEKLSPRTLLLDENSYADELAIHPILFCGKGSKKLKALLSHPHADFSDIPADATHLAQLSYNNLRMENFASLVHTEPLYIKEFYSSYRRD